MSFASSIPLTQVLTLTKLNFGCISESDFINIRNLTTGLPFNEANAERVGPGTNLSRLVPLCKQETCSEAVSCSLELDLM